MMFWRKARDKALLHEGLFITAKNGNRSDVCRRSFGDKKSFLSCFLNYFCLLSETSYKKTLIEPWRNQYACDHSPRAHVVNVNQ